MNYNKHYYKLIERAPTLIYSGVGKRTWRNRDDVYREAHRIIPGCLGGEYTSNNVVYLTPREHYVAHQLLIKMYPNTNNLVYAANMMTVNSRKNNLRKCSNNRQYGWLRERFSVAMSHDQRVRHVGSTNASYGRKGEMSFGYGTKHPVESVRARIEKQKQHWQTHKHPSKATVWCNDGIRDYRLPVERIPSHCALGRIKSIKLLEGAKKARESKLRNF